MFDETCLLRPSFLMCRSPVDWEALDIRPPISRTAAEGGREARRFDEVSLRESGLPPPKLCNLRV